MGSPPIGAGKPTCSPHLNLRVNEYNKRIPLWDFPHSGDSSVDGKPPHEGTTPLLGLFPRWRYRIVDRVGAQIGTDASICCLDFPDSRSTFLQVLPDYGNARIRYIHRGFLVWIIPSHTSLARSYANDFLKERPTDTTVGQITTRALHAFVP